MKYIAGIILYNPDLNRLQENINSIINQVEKLLIIDNGSKNIISIQDLLSEYTPKTVLIKNNKNEGIAKALNQLAEQAYKDKYTWLLTLDQDSICPDNLIEIYNKYTTIENIGIICCFIKDRNLNQVIPTDKQWCYTNICITSASMINLPIWKECNGFTDKLFIDSVDFDYCYNITSHGYKILKTFETSLLHEIGKRTTRYILGYPIILLNHSPLRYYYIIRNNIYIGRKYHLLSKYTVINIKLFIKVFLEHEERPQKIKMMFWGFYHAIIGKFGKFK